MKARNSLGGAKRGRRSMGFRRECLLEAFGLFGMIGVRRRVPRRGGRAQSCPHGGGRALHGPRRACKAALRLPDASHDRAQCIKIGCCAPSAPQRPARTRIARSRACCGSARITAAEQCNRSNQQCLGPAPVHQAWHRPKPGAGEPLSCFAVVRSSPRSSAWCHVCFGAPNIACLLPAAAAAAQPPPARLVLASTPASLTLNPRWIKQQP